MDTRESFTMLYSTITGKATVHDMMCPTVNGKRPKGCLVFDVDADSPELAALQFYQDEEFEERGYKMPKVCKCAER